MSEYLLQTVSLTKQFGKQKAVNALSLNVEKGAIYGLIGRNGAGKTTFMKMATGLASPTSGEIKLFGHDGSELHSQQYRIGVLIESAGIYDDMTAFDNMKMKAIAMGMYSREKIDELLKLVGLSETGRKKAGKFSLGMKQRLGIAMALIGSPDLLVLDEPINGLDPQGIIEIRNVILRLNREQGITVIVSSHILDELSRIATHYGIINQGSLVLELPSDELMAKCSSGIEIKSDFVNDISVVLDGMGIEKYTIIDSQTILVEGSSDKLNVINMEIAKRGITISSIGLKQESLEEFFVKLTGGNEQ